MAWLDREGKHQPLFSMPATHLSPSVSPDGKRLAVVMRDTRGTNVQVHEFGRPSGEILGEAVRGGQTCRRCAVAGVGHSRLQHALVSHGESALLCDAGYGEHYGVDYAIDGDSFVVTRKQKWTVGTIFTTDGNRQQISLHPTANASRC